MASSSPPYLTDWRNSFSLVPKNLQYCPKGKTFRGAHPSVETSGSADTECITSAKALKGRGGGTAKPGPTTDTSSRIARLKKLQTRTRTSNNASFQEDGGTQRGAHASVQNASHGAAPGSRRAQLFGDYGPSNPANTAGQTSGRCGDSSQVIYFKNVFDRVTLNQPASGGLN